MISLKKCRICGLEKPAEEFNRYRPLMCGPCGKAAKAKCAGMERARHADKYREWKRAYKQTEKGKAAAARHAKNNYKPDRNAAQQAVKWALKTGKLTKLPCLICGDDDSLGHHPSYAPDMRLSVTWLCVHHHNQLHNEVAGVGLC